MGVFEFSAQVAPVVVQEGRMSARIVPYGESVPYGDGTVRFERGGLTVPDSVPLTIDHGDSVLDRIGVLERFHETDDGAYADFKISGTPQGEAIRALLRDGAVTDVSVGVRDFTVEHGRDVAMRGVLDHVSVVSHGRFGKTQRPSRVLSVHDEGEPPMAEADTAAPEVATYDDSELRSEIVKLRDELDTVKNRVVEEPKIFRTLGEYVKAKAQVEVHGDEEARDKLAKFAMSADTTTTGAGAVPDYLASEFLSVLATERPFTNSIPNDPIGPYGMTVSYPTMGTKPTVAAQASEHDEPSSTTTSVTTTDFDLVTYAGANRVSAQLIARSQPSFVDILIRELVSQYNKVTDAAGIASVLAARTGAHTAIVADLSASASATFAAFAAANTAIIADMRRPADTIWVAPDKWAELNSLVDSDGRPLLVAPGNGPSNAIGQSSLTSMTAQWHGWTIRLVPDAAAATVLIGIANAAAVLESDPVQLSATNVDSLSADFGIWGLYKAATKYPNAFYDITEA